MRRFGLALLLLIIAVIPIAAQTFACTQNAILTTMSSGAQQIIAAPASGHQIRICAIYFQINQKATPANFGLVQGTGSNCGTGQANLTPQWIGVGGSVQSYTQEIPTNTALFATTVNAVCLNLSAAPTNASVQILWDTY